jgi:Mn2+/Fe2+ NRAMP family transporter
MVLLMLLATRRKVMRSFTLSRRLKAFGWAATGVMALAAAVFLASSVLTR